MMLPALVGVSVALATQAPDELIAIRCTGTEKYMPHGARTETAKAVDLTFILNEHDRSVSRWSEHLGHEQSVCTFEMRGCVVDFGPVMVNVDSEPSAGVWIAATIDRRAGTYYSFVTYPKATASTLATCVKIPLPKFDPSTRQF